MSGETLDTETIVKKSQSNLAFALATLSAARKRDMLSFYAFCRVVDDIADDDDIPQEERLRGLKRWKEGLLHGFESPTVLEAEIESILERYPIDRNLMVAVVDGVASDLDIPQFETFEDLLQYCYKVASVVGLVSIEIFGYDDPQCRAYAVQLGYALQLTNIIRDVGEDADRGRIYLPNEDLKRFGVLRDEILHKKDSEAFRKLLAFQANRAEFYYAEADRLLPRCDERSMLAARMMGEVYHEILHKIRLEHYEVMHRRIGLSKLQKIRILLSHLFEAWFH